MITFLAEVEIWNLPAILQSNQQTTNDNFFGCFKTWTFLEFP